MQRQVPVELGEPAQLAFGLLARGDVAADPLDPDRASVLLDHAARDLEDHDMPVPGAELLLERRAGHLAGHLARGRLTRGLRPCRGQVLREARPDQLGARVAEHPLERTVHLGDLLVHRDGPDRLVRILEEVPVALLALPRGLLGTRALDRDSGQMRRELDEVHVACPALARLAVVEGERAEQPAARRDDGRRPARAETRVERKLAVVAPERVGRDVRDVDALAQVRSRPAGSDPGADRKPVDRLAVGLREAGSRAVAQVQPVAIQQEDGRDDVVTVLLDEPDQPIEDTRQGGAGRDELQQLRLLRGQGLGALPLADVAHDRRDADDLTRGADDRRQRRLGVDPLAVLAYPHGLERLDDLAGAQALVQLRQLAAELGRRQQGDGASDDLLRGVAEHALRGGIPFRHDAVERASDHCVEGRVDDGLALEQRRLTTVLIADVSHVRREARLSTDVDGRDAELERELAPVGPHRTDLDAPAEHRALARREVALEARGVRGPVGRGHHQIDHLPTHHGLAPVSEDALRRGIELDDRTSVVDHDDAVERRVQHRPRARVGLAHRSLALLALGDVEHVALRAERLTGLVADDHGLVPYPGNAAVAPHDAELDRGLSALGEQTGRLGQHALEIVWMADADEEVGARCPVLGRVAEHQRRLGTDVQAGRRRIRLVDVDDQRQPLDKASEVADPGRKRIQPAPAGAGAARGFVVAGHH